MKLLSFAVAILLALSACSKEWTEIKDGVSPVSYDTYLSAGDSDNLQITVNLKDAPPTKEPVDVLLLLDKTGSMGNVIDKIKSSSNEIMLDVRSVYANSNFGVATLADYLPQREPWKLYQDLTNDVAKVSEALSSITLFGGGDLAEAYLRALYEARFLSWRPDARKYIILFGDAPAHDPSFYGKSFGTDPGRDNKVGTSDDLFMKDIVNQLATDKIKIITIFDAGSWYNRKKGNEFAIKGFEYMAKETRGLSIPVGSADDAPAAIIAGIQETYRSKPALAVPKEFYTWFESSPARRMDDSNRRFAFDTVLKLPPGVKDGVYQIPIRIYHSNDIKAGEIGYTWVTIRVGIFNLNWRWLLFGILFLFLLLFMVLKRRSSSSRGSVRLAYNRQGWRMLGNILGVAVLALIIYAIWHYAPGQLTEPPPVPDNLSFRLIE